MITNGYGQCGHRHQQRCSTNSSQAAFHSAQFGFGFEFAILFERMIGRGHRVRFAQTVCRTVLLGAFAECGQFANRHRLFDQRLHFRSIDAGLTRSNVTIVRRLMSDRRLWTVVAWPRLVAIRRLVDSIDRIHGQLKRKIFFEQPIETLIVIEQLACRQSRPDSCAVIQTSLFRVLTTKLLLPQLLHRVHGSRRVSTDRFSAAGRIAPVVRIDRWCSSGVGRIHAVN